MAGKITPHIGENTSLKVVEEKFEQNPLIPIVNDSLKKPVDLLASNLNLAERVTYTPLSTTQKLAQEVIAHINVEMGDLFDQKYVLDKYRECLFDSQDINISYQGFTILHYCFYQMSWVTRPLSESMKQLCIEKGQRLLALIKYLIQNGANINAVDEHDRTPIYFASSLWDENLNTIFWDLIAESKAIVNPINPSVNPLHVMAHLSGKYLVDLVEMGGDVFARDKFKRVPLHCAAMQNIDPRLQNIQCLIYYGPESTECVDIFGNFPLYYAIVFGNSEIQDEIMKNSSVRVINEVLSKIEREGLPETDEELDQFIAGHCIYEEIYNIPRFFKVYIGAGHKKNRNKKEIITRLEETKNKKVIVIEHDDIVYYAHHDGHGFKHIVANKEAAKKFKKDKQKLISQTTAKDSKFYPNVVNQTNYEEWVENCVRQWVKNGADMNHLFVEYGAPVGADDGHETNTIQIYLTEGKLGAHIRPKHLI